MGAPVFESNIDPKSKDAMNLAKYEYPGSDVAISNVLNRTMIELINPNLMKEYCLN